MMGSFSWTDPVNKIKWIRPQHAYTLADVPGYVTPSQVSRAYLHYKYDGQRGRLRKSQAKHCVDNRKGAPLYCTPCYLPDAVYVDLKAAYWSIVRAVGLRPEYLPGKYLAHRGSAFDFPYPEEKLIRNILVSSGLPGFAAKWDGERVNRFRPGNPFLNLMLWSVCMDVLHGIARDMVELGAVYVHTDGYIFPRSQAQAAKNLAALWGLNTGIKYQGECRVWGVATYEFKGSTDTRWRRTAPHFTDKVNPTMRGWLRSRVRKWADWSSDKTGKRFA
jgi:hypothetical protein